MLQFKFCVLLTALSLITVATAQADTRSLVKQNNFFEAAADAGPPATPPTSPWFNFLVDGTTAASPSQDVNLTNHTLGHSVSFKPSTTGVVAGQVSSVTINGSFSIKGWATALNNFTDLNQIPEGITVTFKTATTFSVDAGSYLTLSANGAGSNGLGITQTLGTSGSLDVGETLHVSDMTVTDVAFSGSTPGYTFSNPTISNMGVNILRSGAGTDFNEPTENAGLYSLPPAGTPTIGFGDNALGTGTVQSNVLINNGFGVALATFTNTYIGAWDFKMLAGSMQLRGVGLQYNLGYDVVAAPVPVAGDYNHNGVVDAADYVLWRKGDLAADGNADTVVDQADFDYWRARFENVSGAGAGGGLSSGSVPEPSSVAMLLLGLIGSCACRRGSRG